MSIYTEEASTKYAKELSVVEKIADHIAVNDADVSVAPSSANIGAGFTESATGAITFTVPEELAAQQQNDYRTSAQEHANKFADVFNSSLVSQGPNGPVPLTDKPILKAEGDTVHVDLGAMRKLLSEHAIADKLPKISETYSVQYMSEKAQNQAQGYVEQTIRQRAMERQQAQAEEKVFGECEKVLENPEYMEQLKRENPRAAVGVKMALDEIQGVAEQVKQDPALMDQIREQNERFANLVEKVSEQNNEKDASAQEPSKADAEKARRAANEEGKGAALG